MGLFELRNFFNMLNYSTLFRKQQRNPLLFSFSPRGEGRDEGEIKVPTKEKARNFRKNQTEVEKWLWRELREYPGD